MSGDTGGPGAAGGELIVDLVGGGRGVVGANAWLGQNFKLAGIVSESAESERSKKGVAVLSLSDGSDAFFGFIPAELKFPVAVAQNSGGLQNDPEIALGVGHEGLHRADGQRGWSGLRKLAEGHPIKTIETLVRADP